MRLNGLGAPDEVTLVRLNKIEPAPTKPETKQSRTRRRTLKRDTASIVTNSDTTRPNAENWNATNGYKLGKITDKLTTAQAKCLIVIPVESLTKQRIVGMEPPLPTIPDLGVIIRRNERWTPQPNKQ